MARKQQKRATRVKRQTVKNVHATSQADSTYFLKLVVFLILGSQWIYIEHLPEWQAPIPVGLFIGLIFATHEHFQIDRKIEYAVLLVATFLSFWLPLGLVIKV